MYLRGWLAVTLLALAWACKSPEEPRKPVDGSAPRSGAAKEAPTAPEGAAPVKKVVSAQGEVSPPDGFEPLAACHREDFEATSIPPVPVLGSFVKDEGAALDVHLKVVSGRLEVRDDRLLLTLSSDTLAPCSPFRDDGKLATMPSVALRLERLEKGESRFPKVAMSGDASPEADPLEPAGQPGLNYWNYSYMTEQEIPMTLKSRSVEDSGLVVVDEIMPDPQTRQPVVAGRLLLCKARGEQGWAVGRFEVPICDMRADRSTPIKALQEALDAHSRAAIDNAAAPTE